MKRWAVALMLCVAVPALCIVGGRESGLLKNALVSLDFLRYNVFKAWLAAFPIIKFSEKPTIILFSMI
jgi:hypothetical protein